MSGICVPLVCVCITQSERDNLESIRRIIHGVCDFGSRSPCGGLRATFAVKSEGPRRLAGDAAQGIQFTNLGPQTEQWIRQFTAEVGK